LWGIGYEKKEFDHKNSLGDKVREPECTISGKGGGKLRIFEGPDKRARQKEVVTPNPVWEGSNNEGGGQRFKKSYEKPLRELELQSSYGEKSLGVLSRFIGEKSDRVYDDIGLEGGHVAYLTRGGDATKKKTVTMTK